MNPNVAIAGATGAVGADLIALLEEREFPVASLRLLASARSAGTLLRFRGEDVPVEALTADSFSGTDLALFSCGGPRSREFGPAAVRAGAIVVDNSSAFRMDGGVPLVVPEINAHVLGERPEIVANPNCTTIVALMAVAPLHVAFGAVRLRAASYQAASGAGARGMAELEEQVRAFADGTDIEPEVFPHPLAFNVIPHVGAFLDDGTTEEEAKLADESRKILEHPDLAVSAICVRVPVLRAHCVACWLETERPVSPDAAREVLREAPGVMVLDDPQSLAYPMPLTAARVHPVQVGRIRAEERNGNGLSFFVAGDQLLKGAALNAIQIAEVLLERGHL